MSWPKDGWLKSFQGRTFFIVGWAILLSMGACVPQSNTKRTPKNSSALGGNTPTPTPTPYSQSLNFFQYGATTTTSILTLSSQFADTFVLRGNQVLTYLLAGNNTASPLCLVSYFPGSSGKNHLILTAFPTNVLVNPTTGLRDYYFKMQSYDADINKANCQTGSLLAALSTATPGANYAYINKDLCPGCTGDLTSSFVKLYTAGGGLVSTITTSNLGLRLTRNTPDQPVSSCSLDSQCATIGYDCCLKGQCVDDKTIRPNVNTSGTGYQLALLDIASDPNRIRKYPDFFYLCPNNTGVTPTPTPTPDPIATAADNLESLRDLYDCTTHPIDSELSICSKVFEKASVSILAGGGAGATFTTDLDDRSYSSTSMGASALSPHSFYEMTYAGETLYLENTVSMNGGTIVPIYNDTLSDTQGVTVTKTPSTGAPHDRLKLRYKVDGSCTKVNSTTALCQKYYVQGQNSTKINDHESTGPLAQVFRLPYYADGTKNIKVYVDDTLKLENTHYTRATVSGQITMTFAAATPVFNNQVVRMDYYVSTATYPGLMTAKTAAQTTVNTICKCGAGDNCSLSPLTQDLQGVETVVDYKCVYPLPPTPEAPLFVTVSVNTKSAPARFFDTSGVNYDQKSIVGVTQELTAFSYTNNNLLLPNNALGPIGFNEIYGSFTTVAGSAKAPSVVSVKKGQSYDIYSDRGTFTPCPTCGADYYPSVNSLFPAELLFRGGGYLPDPSRTSRLLPSSLLSAQYRADDLLFGRACWIPATMIAWTHQGNTDVALQRRNRLGAQHFLFANGYQRDWYGFDYGALIGSFDGVSWFAIGSNRRVTALSNKLFLAVNAYFADTTLENSYQVSVMASSTVNNSGPLSSSDLDNDGAQCQRYHVCTTDSDCIKQVGWDYSCQAVGNIKTTWPTFDNNGNEQAGSAGSETSKRLVDIIGGVNGASKRCVYRGVGAPCHGAYSTIATASTYHQTTLSGLNACSANNYCEDLSSAKFNDRINRFARPPLAQNNSSDFLTALKEDEFGLAARIMGRPFEFNGSSSVAASVTTQLTTNLVTQMCVHGRDPLLSLVDNTFTGQHTRDPGASHLGDKVSNIGMTYTSTLVASPQYFASCAVLNAANGLLQLSSPLTDLSDSSVKLLSATQNTSTNILKALEVSGVELVKDFDSNLVTSPFYAENRCLKNANAACFTDTDCAPNNLISSKVLGLDAATTGLSEGEVKYWQEELICGQKTLKTNSAYELKNNRCCRDIGKVLTIYPDENSSAVLTTDAGTGPGVDVALSSATRYSRMNVVYDQLNKVVNPLSSLKIVPLNSGTDISAGTGDPTLHPFSQYETFEKIGSRTCCTENWVRNFSTSNGGGHYWTKDKLQNIDKSIFQCLNWKDCSATPAACNATPFTCTSVAACGVRNIGTAEVDRYQEWLGRLELTGVPQILIQSDTNGAPGWAVAELITCLVDTTTQLTSTGHLPNTVNSVLGGTATADAIDGPNRGMIRADDQSDFTSAIKQVFSPTEIACCLPAGETIPSSTTGEMCCTGKAYQNRCCLEDYTDVTVYLNRFISSEAKDRPSASFDPKTGYLKDPSEVAQIALNKNLCCSSTTAMGQAVAELKIPGLEANAARVRRWVTTNNDADNFNGAADAYDAGLKWNNHVYCVPESD